MKYGRDLGLSCLQALQGIYVVNGKPSLYGETYWALVISHPDFEDVEESVDDKGARCVIKRRGRSPSIGEFTMKDAEVAGINTGNVWKKYPKNMMLWRARHRASAIFADALRGIIPREVAMDYIDGEVLERTPPPAPVAFADPVAGTRNEKPVPEAKVVSIDTKPAGDETKSVQAETTDKINETQSKEFRAAYKAAGWSAAAVAEYLKDTLKVGRLGDITVAMFADAMAWAKRGPEKASEPQPEKKAAPAKTDPENGDHAFCLKAWEALGTNQDDRNDDLHEYTKDDVIDWEALATALHARREERGV